jgi:hypothetical protein
MKKMYYLMTAVIVALAFNACSTNDNPITPSTQSGRAVITLNTAAMYEEVGIAKLIESNLNKLLCIADTVLIYDQNGRLVNKLGTMTKSLEPQTFEFDDLHNGTYTLVGWQTSYIDDGTTPDQHFALADEEELSTVKVIQLYPIHSTATTNGLASATVTVNGNSFEATVTPKFVGSIFDLKSEKSPQEYGFEEIDLYHMDQVTQGFWLDPARSEDDRWIIQDQYADPYPFAYLYQEEEEYLHYTLEHGDDMILSLVTWTPVNDNYEPDEIVRQGRHKLQDGSNVVYYFDVDRISYQPPFLGQPEELPTWKADRDAGKLVNDPYLKWGSNLAEVETHIKAKQFWAVGNYELEFWEGEGWHRWYYVAPNFTEQYLFETKDGQDLTCVMCICHDATLPIDIFTKSLQLQGYTYLGKLHYPNNDFYDDFFLSADGETEALVYANTYGGWIIDYLPFYSEDLDYIIPANLAPASSKIRSIAPMRHSSSRSATMRNNFMKSNEPMRSLNTFVRN